MIISFKQLRNQVAQFDPRGALKKITLALLALGGGALAGWRRWPKRRA